MLFVLLLCFVVCCVVVCSVDCAFVSLLIGCVVSLFRCVGFACWFVWMFVCWSAV